jgi:hypothetical protein
MTISEHMLLSTYDPASKLSEKLKFRVRFTKKMPLKNQNHFAACQNFRKLNFLRKMTAKVHSFR